MHSDIWQFRWREKTADGENLSAQADRVASKPSHREEHVRQDPQSHVGAIQSRLSVPIL